MTLSPGVRLGPYEILGRLGAGGMGEVYRAHDTRLDRTVAIKVLAHHLTRDPDMRRRFEREARAVASLSHPHICHLNDIGQHEGTDFLVMEYLEGETLAHRLTRPGGSHAPPLPIDEVLRYAVEMAEALSEAHRRGIVHRDLKPGNVIITKSGVKLLDFGLAKLLPAGVGSAAALSTMPHRQQPLTDKGTIVGTWQYMAPEQLEGKEADARSDIFAFGAVVYEMATGRKAFEGESHASLIAAILEREPPPILERQPVAPPALDRVVRKCLAKSPDARWQTARDLADELKWIAEQRLPTSTISSAGLRISTSSRWTCSASCRTRSRSWPATSAAAPSSWTCRARSAPRSISTSSIRACSRSDRPCRSSSRTRCSATPLLAHTGRRYASSEDSCCVPILNSPTCWLTR
jgi:serine/threonine protein kinase